MTISSADTSPGKICQSLSCPKILTGVKSSKVLIKILEMSQEQSNLSWMKSEQTTLFWTLKTL